MTSSVSADLSRDQKAELEFRLENLSNELELLIRNHRADETDVRQQERQLNLAHAYTRIPFEVELPALEKELRSLGHAAGVEVVHVALLSRSPAPRQIPHELDADQTSFRLNQSDAVESLTIRIVMKGDPGAIDQFSASWNRKTARLIDFPDGQDAFRSFPDGQGHRTIDARIYRFRKIEFPRVRPRNPLALLPPKIRRDPALLAQTDPRLWGYIQKIQKLTPIAFTLYPTRGRFFLNDARMAFLLSKLNIDPSVR